jgi:hypothetical protein
VRIKGWTSRAASAEVDGRRLELARRGLWRRSVAATDATGAAIGRFSAHGLRRGGSLRWEDRELVLRPASRWRERYALTDGRRELALIESTGWGRRPLKVTLDEPQGLDPRLLLFAVFVVRGLANDAAADSAATGS